MNPEWRDVFKELERRKDAEEDPCDSCDGSGRSSNDSDSQPLACSHCLGQGVLLTAQEYDVLIELGRPPDDEILDSELLE